MGGGQFPIATEAEVSAPPALHRTKLLFLRNTPSPPDFQHLHSQPHSSLLLENEPEQNAAMVSTDGFHLLTGWVLRCDKRMREGLWDHNTKGTISSWTASLSLFFGPPIVLIPVVFFQNGTSRLILAGKHQLQGSLLSLRQARQRPCCSRVAWGSSPRLWAESNSR